MIEAEADRIADRGLFDPSIRIDLPTPVGKETLAGSDGSLLDDSGPCAPLELMMLMILHRWNREELTWSE